GLQRGGDRLDIAHLEIEDRAGVVELRLFGHGQHQAHAAAIEESHFRPGLEEESQAQRVAIEGHGFIDIVHVDGSLTDGGGREIRICHIRSFRVACPSRRLRTVASWGLWAYPAGRPRTKSCRRRRSRWWCPDRARRP